MDPRSRGWTEVQDANQDTQKICDEVKPQVEEKTGKCYEVYKALQFRSQPENGTNFYIKVHVGGSNYLHLMVHQSVSGEVKVNCVFPASKDKPLNPYQCQN